MMEKKNLKKRHQLRAVIITALLVAALMITGIFAVRNYENSVVDTYARQQDNYVRLALDQIKAGKDSDDREIIKNVLSSIDGSSTSYWTFSKENTLIYVRNVLETSEYRGYTSDSYYRSASAKLFIKSLSDNEVSHGIIKIGNDRFIASGVVFSLGNTSYRLCFLTEDSVILDNNSFIAGRVTFYLVWAAMIILIIMVILISSVKIDSLSEKAYEDNKTIISLNKKLEKKIKTESFDRDYSPENNAYSFRMLPMFKDSFRTHGIYSAPLVRVMFSNKSDRDSFLFIIPDDMKKRVLRFRGHSNDYGSEAGLLFPGESVEYARMTAAEYATSGRITFCEDILKEEI